LAKLIDVRRWLSLKRGQAMMSRGGAATWERATDWINGWQRVPMSGEKRLEQPRDRLERFSIQFLPLQEAGTIQGRVAAMGAVWLWWKEL